MHSANVGVILTACKKRKQFLNYHVSLHHMGKYLTSLQVKSKRPDNDVAIKGVTRKKK